MLKQAKDFGAEKVILLSNKKLEAAINLYKKLGFKEVELSKADIEAYKRVDIRMEIYLKDFDV
jgi:ribosomal protein S18 acetylase RimI-like enzyme